MDRWRNFLQECVYYPCSSLHGVPVKLLLARFPRFFYCDYSVSREDFQKEIQAEGFKGYRTNMLIDLDPTDILGVSWEQFREEHEDTFSKLHFEWSAPFISFCTLQRDLGLTDSHGPETFELMFARAEAIAMLTSAFNRRRISPKCLVHVRSGIGFGGNFSNYPKLLERCLRENPGGLPQFILHDSMGVGHGGDHLNLIDEYREVKTWGYPDGGYLKLVERSDGEQRLAADVPAAASRRQGRG